MTNSTLEYGPLIIGIGGGLALFLYGMRKMTESLKIVAGARMKSLLARLTTNRFTAALAGATVTAVIQSSSVTTVLVVGFITSGLLTLTQSVGVIIGANIGTTVTAQIIAFKVTKYALILIAGGFALEILGRIERYKLYGSALMGLGLIFFGMNLMSDAASPLRSYEPFMQLMQQMSHPLPGILVGAVFTSLVQSSSATTGIVIVMASQGIVSLEAGIALILGSNVGTCVTALIAGIGRPREALQAAVAHVIFNIGGVLLCCGFIPHLADLVRLVSNETPRQIANAHTVFNLGSALIFIGFAGPLAKLVRLLVPSKKDSLESAGQPQYLDAFYLEQPEVALDRVRLEIGRLGEMVVKMVDQSFPAVSHGLPQEIAELDNAESIVDELHGEIITYLGKLSQDNLVESQVQQIYQFIAASNEWENASDLVGTSLVNSAKRRLANQFQVSDETRTILLPLHAAVLSAGNKTLRSLLENDASLAVEVTNSKPQITELAAKAQSHLIKRLVADEPERLNAFRIENDIIENYQRLHTKFRRIAKEVIKGETNSADETQTAQQDRKK